MKTGFRSLILVLMAVTVTAPSAIADLFSDEDLLSREEQGWELIQDKGALLIDIRDRRAYKKLILSLH